MPAKGGIHGSEHWIPALRFAEPVVGPALRPDPWGRNDAGIRDSSVRDRALAAVPAGFGVDDAVSLRQYLIDRVCAIRVCLLLGIT